VLSRRAFVCLHVTIQKRGDELATKTSFYITCICQYSDRTLEITTATYLDRTLFSCNRSQMLFTSFHPRVVGQTLTACHVKYLPIVSQMRLLIASKYLTASTFMFRAHSRMPETNKHVELTTRESITVHLRRRVVCIAALSFAYVNRSPIICRAIYSLRML